MTIWVMAVSVTPAGPTASARSFRSRWAAAASSTAWLEMDSMNRLNDYASTVPPRTLIRTPTGLVASYRPTITPTDILAIITADLIDVLGGPGHTHLRQCAADTCDGIYLDTSRGRQRTWCSSRTCGNRARVQRFRTKSQVQP